MGNATNVIFPAVSGPSQTLHVRAHLDYESVLLPRWALAHRQWIRKLPVPGPGLFREKVVVTTSEPNFCPFQEWRWKTQWQPSLCMIPGCRVNKTKEVEATVQGLLPPVVSSFLDRMREPSPQGATVLCLSRLTLKKEIPVCVWKAELGGRPFLLLFRPISAPFPLYFTSFCNSWKIKHFPILQFLLW